jgi:hypothetical protein
LEKKLVRITIDGEEVEGYFESYEKKKNKKNKKYFDTID